MGEKFDPSGTSFYAVIAGRPVYIYNGYTYNKTGLLTAGDTEITFDYFGARLKQSITVEAATPSKLELLNPPSRTRYTIGERLDLSGARLRITYSNKTQSPVFGADELETYGINIALGSDSNVSTSIVSRILL